MKQYVKALYKRQTSRLFRLCFHQISRINIRKKNWYLWTLPG